MLALCWRITCEVYGDTPLINHLAILWVLMIFSVSSSTLITNYKYMAFESVTDELIAELLKCPKRISNPQARSINKPGHDQVNYKVAATDGSDHKFEIYKRQNVRDGMEASFSCGINWLAPSGEPLILRRYNGPHVHPNHLEGEKLPEECHIHVATERYIQANRKPEGYAETTNRYNSIDGAFHCLVTDCNVSGVTTRPDEPFLFE